LHLPDNMTHLSLKSFPAIKPATREFHFGKIGRQVQHNVCNLF
jgi:hypothetical protein